MRIDRNGSRRRDKLNVMRLLGMMGCLVLLLCGCGKRAAEKGISMNDARVTALAAKMRITLPSDAMILGLRDTSGLDNAAFLKVEFGKPQWPGFVAASPLKGEEFSDERRYLLGPNEGWWDPERPRELPTAQVRLPEGTVLNVGIDQSDDSRVVVYLMWHET